MVVRGGNGDLLERVVGRVEELGHVDRAVRRRRVRNEDRRAVVAVLVDVRQEHLRVGRVGLRREHHPAAVRREAVPRVHQSTWLQRISRASPPSRRHDPQATVGTHAAGRCGTGRRRPTAVGRHLGERVAHPVVRGALRWPCGWAARALVEGHAVQVVLDRRLVGVVRRSEAIGRPGRRGPSPCRAGEDDRLAVGRPDRAAVHVGLGSSAPGSARISPARVRLARRGCRASGRRPAGSGSQEVGDVEGLVHRGDDVAPVGGDPRQEPDRLVPLGLVGERVPGHHVVAV